MTEAIVTQILKGVGNQGGTGNVMEALGYSSDHFQTAFEYANAIQNMDLVKLLYSNFNQNKIIVEFTLLGKARYEATR